MSRYRDRYLHALPGGCPKDRTGSAEDGILSGAAACVSERAQGRGSRKSGVPGEEIFLSVRLWPGENENGKAGDRTPERPGADCVDACGIKGLDQESPINTGFERSGPFSLTRKTG